MTPLTKFLLTAAISAINVSAFAQPQQAISDTTYTITDRQLSGFSSLRIQGPFDIYVTQGTTESVRMDAPVYILPRMVTEVNGTVLDIHNRHDNWSQGPKSWYSDKSWWHTHKRIIIYVTAKSLNGISISGSGHIFFSGGIAANNFKVRVRGSGQMQGIIDVKTLRGKISGSSNIKLSGKAENSTVKISGSGHFSAGDLVTLNSAVRVSGSGHADINANEKVEAVVHGSAYVGYTGTAKLISASRSGSGTISKL